MCEKVKYLLKENVRSCTYDFDSKKKWLEFKIVLNEIFDEEKKTINFICLNENLATLQQKGWSYFF